MESKDMNITDSRAEQKTIAPASESGLIGFVDGRTYITVGIYPCGSSADSLDEKVRKLVVKDIEKAG